MSFDLTNKNISDTYQNLLQKTGSDGRLYDLTGNKVRDLTIDGTLTANSYIVSQSETHYSSGSTAFGNSSDDSHLFTGNITASNNISASGGIFSGVHYFNADTSDDFIFYLPTSDAIAIQSQDININGTNGVGIGYGVTQNNSAKLDVNGNINTNLHITASGNISASGTSHTFGNRIKMGDNITGAFDGLVVGGAISASNGLYAERIFSENPTGGEPSIKLSTDQVVEIGDVQGQTNEVILKVDNTNSKITTTSGHQVVIAGQTPAANMELTVAGDISASGVINAPEGVFTDNIEINKTAIPKLQLKNGTNDRKDRKSSVKGRKLEMDVRRG